MDEQIKLVVEALYALAKTLPEVARVSVSKDLGSVTFATRSEEGAAQLCTRLGISETRVFDGCLHGDTKVGDVRVSVYLNTAPKPLDQAKLANAFAKVDSALGGQ